jgi:methyl-galactoside transport system substrate-binding protein
MKILKRILALIMITIITTVTLNNKCAYAQNSTGAPVKAAVVLSSFNNIYISLVRENLEKIQKENGSKIEFTFFDGKGNQNVQNDIINSVLSNDYDLLLVNLADINANDSVISKVKPKNIPIVFFNVAPFVTDSIKSYPKSFVVATDAEQSGVLEGTILVDEWKNNKKAIDKNGDNKLQYVMLREQVNDTLTIARTKYPISAINDAGINTDQIALLIASSASEDQESAKAALEPVFIRYDGKIEAIIANNDTLALGATKLLQKYGYNTGDESKRIPIVGINGVPETIDLVNKNIMDGTVIQDAPAMAQALYTIGMNLVNNKSPLDGTDYKPDESGVIIQLPYKGYIKQ